ncbi:LysR substrate-binding domain-containing protein [Acidovorax sp. NCPPB 2350]|nr:LysR substrate-binding domain-containing protein [Acidovorax sp. NCPPB 2350]
MPNAKPTEYRLSLTADLNRWRTFLVIAELGSLTRAAHFLDSNQSLLSRQLNALERECGARLFNRTGRGVELSDVGTRILPQVRQLLGNADVLEKEIVGEAREPAGQVTIGSLTSISVSLIGPLFTTIRERYPAIRLKILEGSSGQLEEWLNEERVDIGILYRYGCSLSEQEQVLATLDSYLIGCAGDSVTAASEVPFSALHELPLILPSPPHGLRGLLDSMARREGISLNPAIDGNSLQLQTLLVEREKLYAVLPLHAVWREREAGHLQAARIVSPSMRQTLSMVLARSKGPSRAVTAVTARIADLVDEMAKKGMWHPGPTA